MRGYRVFLTIIIIVFSFNVSYSVENIMKIINLSWTAPEKYIDFIERNKSEKGTYSIDNIRSLIIINDIKDRAEFIEGYIRKKDLVNNETIIVNEKMPVTFNVSVRNGEKIEVDKLLENGKNWEFTKNHPLIYNSKINGEDVYNVEMLGLKVVFFYEKISNQRAVIRLDIFYDYIMGWNSNKKPIVDKKSYTIEETLYIGDKKKFKDIVLGNRVVDCSVKLGYNILNLEN